MRRDKARRDHFFLAAPPFPLVGLAGVATGRLAGAGAILGFWLGVGWEEGIEAGMLEGVDAPCVWDGARGILFEDPGTL